MKYLYFFLIICSITLLAIFLYHQLYVKMLTYLPGSNNARQIYAGIFIFMCLSFIAGMLLERTWSGWLSDWLVWIGSWWLGLTFYLLIFMLLADGLTFIGGLLHVPAIPSQIRVIIGAVIICFSGLLCIYGYFQASAIKVTRLELSIPKQANGLKSLNIVVASDIHMSIMIDNARTSAIVDKINSLQPDIVLLPGDLVDGEIKPVIRRNIGAVLENIKSRYGVFAVAGNHEYIAGIDKALSYLQGHKVVFLRDEYVKIADSFYLIGRDDIRGQQFGHQPRLQLADVMKTVDKSLPLILMDHEPLRLDDAREQDIDLQLSGHTHHGQIFPASFITRLIFEKSWGYLHKGNTHYYVSCGVGTWGPPMRIGTDAEVVNIVLKFETPQSAQ